MAHKKNKEKAVVLFSGGLDSTVSLWWAKSKGYRCHALSFDYGQKHKKELKVASRLARKAGVPHQTVRFRLPWSGSSLTSRSKKIPHHVFSQIGKKKIPNTYVPGRNTLFLSFGLSLADQIGARVLVIGANAIDYSGYPDCRPGFLYAFEETATRGSKMGAELKMKFKIEAPLLKLKKSGIIKLGRKLRAPIESTWSCYQGSVRPCGQCDSCKLRDKGFAEAGLS